MSNANANRIGKMLNLLVDPSQARQNSVLLGFTAIALLSVPEPISGAKILWLILAALALAISMTNIHLAHNIEAPGDSLPHIIVGFAAAMIAVVISLFVRPVSGLLLLIVRMMWGTTSERRPFVTAALMVLTIPMWIWLAAGAWRWELLLLIPILGLGLLAVNHLMDTHAWPEGEDRILSQRAHRYAAWIAIALTGILMVLVGLLGDVSRSWLALAGVTLAAAIPLEAGVGTTDEGSAKPGLRIVMAAYFIAIACWLIGIQ